MAVSQPAFAAPLGWLLAAAASVSLAASASWLGLPGLAVVLVALVPLLAHCTLMMRSRRRSDAGDTLLVFPGKGWRMADGRDLYVHQAWHHVFGLTLTFNCAKHPHNLSERLTLTIWRCSVAPETYRRLSVAVAWHLQQPGKVLTRESV